MNLKYVMRDLINYMTNQNLLLNCNESWKKSLKEVLESQAKIFPLLILSLCTSLCDFACHHAITCLEIRHEFRYWNSKEIQSFFFYLYTTLFCDNERAQFGPLRSIARFQSISSAIQPRSNPLFCKNQQEVGYLSVDQPTKLWKFILPNLKKSLNVTKKDFQPYYTYV